MKKFSILSALLLVGLGVQAMAGEFCSLTASTPVVDAGKTVTLSWVYELPVTGPAPLYEVRLVGFNTPAGSGAQHAVNENVTSVGYAASYTNLPGLAGSYYRQLVVSRGGKETCRSNPVMVTFR
ncbi:hypothetical protein [Chitinimonas koreensis]|uniref:hypothetical protein n=1 Tax=Chitinimonas koreensis TaxID=356302 RepID=UPI000428A8AF|nr:hypothetical protein [Chitinimonas koreensis]QNM97633.1 hypothetical protein H9L41_04855 [Chitinimonas koreensis]